MILEQLASVVGAQTVGRILLGLIGLLLGLLPLIFGIAKKQISAAILAFVLCGAVSAFGLPLIAVLVSLLGTYFIIGLCGKTEQENRNRNRKQFSGVLRKERENGKIFEREYVENTGAANAAWPPIAHTVDEEAMKACQEMLREENERSSSTKTDAEKQTIYLEERRAK